MEDAFPLSRRYTHENVQGLSHREASACRLALEAVTHARVSPFPLGFFPLAFLCGYFV